MFTITVETYELTGTYILYLDYKKYGVYKSREDVSVAIDAIWDKYRRPLCR